MSTPSYLPPDSTTPAASGYTPPGAEPGPQPDAAPRRAAAGYLPPDASPAVGGSSQPDAPAYVPPDAHALPSSVPAAGYTPPSASAPSHADSATPATPPPVAGPTASRYVPPAVGASAPAAAAPAPAQAPRRAQPTVATDAPEPPGGPTAPRASGRRISLVLLIIAGVIVLAVVGVAIAWFMGAFQAPYTRLPATVGQYAFDVSTRKQSASQIDAGIYRAGSGDLYQASIVKNAPKPESRFSASPEDQRLQADNVFCTAVSKGGKGGTCVAMLPNGSAIYVSSSTRHTAQEVAQFTKDLAGATR